jgi:hypothetical protein
MQADVNYERLPEGRPTDETDINLRAHLSRIPSEKLRQYDPSWTDEQVMEWDGNFRDDDCLMLVTSERDVEIADYREAIEEHIGFRRQYGDL